MKILLIIFASLFLIYSSIQYENKVFAIHFVDEEDNLVLGKYLLDNKKLYGDLFSHHQPYGYILSAGIQKVTDPNSIFLLIKRHREAIIVWSFIWSILLILRFGWLLLVFVTIYELSKVYLFGNLFLAESLVVYPLIYLFSSLFKLRKRNKWEILFLGSLISFSALTLSPVWPVLLFTLIIIWYQENKSINFLKFVAIGTIPIIVISAFFINFNDYLYNAFYINLFYYIPLTHGESALWGIIKGFSAPVLSFFVSSNESPTIYLIRIFSLGLILGLGYLVKLKEYKSAALLIVTLGLLNLRYIDPGAQYYRGFHLLPWFASLILVVTLIFEKVFNKNKAIGLILMIGLLGSTIYYCSNEFLTVRDINKDFYINYSRQFSIGEAIRIMKTEKDTLFVAPDEWLVYWQADINPASKMINYYAWMDKVPVLKNEIDRTFRDSPPTFVYLNLVGTGFEPYLDNYINLVRDGKNVNLYVEDDRFSSLSKEQLNQLKFHNFELIKQ
ncbi:MAG: hypothetical protein ACD_31C00003G0016 [uncultured bacterium]|uniref:Glycosyltransferase RgtA/B/C/D-like domain-containing protein n=4 Tax=Candidatus Daviesiibacteriota TaxID=1752718 RepID=A0A0G0F2I6_9BACT|nr:MAG: hypothetical protein ACD_31C00003G0016 [uncultured bacterium]KKQ07800.1 MAG: hypothetical protein US19_C0037G0007 [Candidatus Daviesbacteria bacterium GW2011_GWB1_36_5]KKQ15441.1 MAG: hypothetical protein US28_C0016G0003 [Candidatus Daviesbacteria bacterium GW2011_GWA1_36_8]OGE17465.1 MAG: hypothetical protein A2858_00975 [Candidatus Daviesbacteria bacterium RIFCSPHIGHO2_01_FULL_36_37]OGE36560.1 MAG: hypothetical protein A3E66_02820 [Candidatus Daviesbacteria bacterium RIFCSPHIGHO2_12_F